MDTANSPALLLLDVPSAALAGIDLLSFTATPKFRGIKNLPTGIHFAFAGATTAFSERHGICFEIPSQTTTSDTPLIVTKWDPATETLRRVTDEAEVLRQRANLGTIWREGLAPYRQQANNASSSTDTTQTQEEISDWPSLTSSLTPSLLSRITTDGHLSSASSSKADLEAIPGITVSDLNDEEENELHFLPIDLKQTWRAGATGRERTEAAQDRSWALENLILHHCSSADEVIGELQFCFLMILTLNNFSALEQWKRLISLLLTCKASVPKHAGLFVSAIATLRLQLQHCRDAENGLIDLADEGGSLLKTLLVRFRKGLDSLSQAAGAGAGPEEVQDVLYELDDLESFLQTEHAWQFGGAFAKRGTLELEDGEEIRGVATGEFDEEDETGEFAPVVVALTEEERRALGVDGGEEVVLHESLSRASLDEAVGGAGSSLSERGLQVEEASSGSEDEEEDRGEDGRGDGGGGVPSDDDEDGEEEEEEMHDLDDMDARY